MRLLANVDAYGEDVALVSVTAPGADVLPWSDAGDLAHRTVVPASAWRWNRDAPARWRRMHRLAAQRVRRSTGHPFWIVSRAWEYQRRGVLHNHVALPMGTARDRHAAHCYVRELDQLRHRFGFGYVDRGRWDGSAGGRRLARIAPGAAAAYMAKYLTPMAEASKSSLTETVMREDVPPMVVYVARRLTGKTGVTMKTLRVRRIAYVVARDRGISFAVALEALLEDTPSRWLLVGDAAVRGP